MILATSQRVAWLRYLAPLPIIDYWTSQPTRGLESHWKYYLNIVIFLLTLEILSQQHPHKAKFNKILSLVGLPTVVVHNFQSLIKLFKKKRVLFVIHL